MCQMLKRANRRSNSTWLRIVILSVHIRASLWSPWHRGSWISSSIGPVAQHVIKDLGSFCLSIHCHRVNFIPRLVPCACEMADSGSPGYCTVTRFAMRGREPGPCGPLEPVRKFVFPDDTLLTLPGTHPGPGTERAPREWWLDWPLEGLFLQEHSRYYIIIQIS